LPVEQAPSIVSAEPPQELQMEKWITRAVATLVACGALGLFWTFGMFTAVPAQQGRLTALSGVEMQLIGIPLLIGLVVGWGTLHLFALADREERPRLYVATCITLLLAVVAAIYVGAQWGLARVAA
jgi:lysylphosphatidylglycerol synthetase-like protein (DUF2156 family)